MKTLARSANGDIFLSAGQFAMADDREAQAQILKAAILTVKGELQFDTERGVPYFDTIFLDPNKINLWHAYVIDRVRSFDWVTNVIELTQKYDPKEKTIRYKLKVATDDGIVTVENN